MSIAAFLLPGCIYHSYSLSPSNPGVRSVAEGSDYLYAIFGLGAHDGTLEDAIADGHIARIHSVRFEDDLVLFLSGVA